MTFIEQRCTVNSTQLAFVKNWQCGPAEDSWSGVLSGKMLGLNSDVCCDEDRGSFVRKNEGNWYGYVMVEDEDAHGAGASAEVVPFWSCTEVVPFWSCIEIWSPLLLLLCFLVTRQIFCEWIVTTTDGILCCSLQGVRYVFPCYCCVANLVRKPTNYALLFCQRVVATRKRKSELNCVVKPVRCSA